MRFSIIVPVYKVERYLCACVDSVLSQSFGDFELILVDDGSPDRCPMICDAYAVKDRRVRVIHQENKGLSGARNTGIFAAKGEYIGFLDGDDLLCKGILEQIDQYITNNETPNIIIGNVIYWDSIGEKIINYKQNFDNRPKDKSILELNEVYARQHIQLPWEAYHHFYCRAFLYANNLFFTEGLSGAEDVDFYLRLLSKVDTYVLTNVCLIKYRLNRVGSIITAPGLHSVLGKLTVFCRAFEQSSIFPNAELMRSYFADYFAHSILSVEELNKESDKETCYRFIEEHLYILDGMSNRTEYVAARMVWKFLGLKAGTQVLTKTKRLYKRVNRYIRKYLRK